MKKLTIASAASETWLPGAYPPHLYPGGGASEDEEAGYPPEPGWRHTPGEFFSVESALKLLCPLIPEADQIFLFADNHQDVTGFDNEFRRGKKDKASGDELLDSQDKDP